MFDKLKGYDLNPNYEFVEVFLDLTKDRWLSAHPERKDLLAFVRGGFKSKRLKKKFEKTPDRYWAEKVLCVGFFLLP